MILRLENARALVGEDQLRGAEVPLRGGAVVFGNEDPGWDQIEGAMKEVVRKVKDATNERRKGETDIEALQCVCDAIHLSRREAGDRRVWHYATVLRFREYVHARWTSGEMATENRMLGDIRRNALAHLWWTADTLGERGLSERPYCERLFAEADARLRLWIIDFEPFYGRAELARAVIDHCIANQIRGDKEVDRLFKALGALAAVAEFDLYSSNPQALIDDAEALKAALHSVSAV